MRVASHGIRHRIHSDRVSSISVSLRVHPCRSGERQTSRGYTHHRFATDPISRRCTLSSHREFNQSRVGRVHRALQNTHYRFGEYNSGNIEKSRLGLIATRNLQVVPSRERAPSKPPHAPRAVQEGAWDRENGESRSNCRYSRRALAIVISAKRLRPVSGMRSPLQQARRALHHATGQPAGRNVSAPRDVKERAEPHPWSSLDDLHDKGHPQHRSR